jgi:SagB-type dehydrogenase family enzyme
MTKFLEQALSDLVDSSLNRETERLFAYHHATKHSYDSVRASAHFLDWRNQPDPFRTYEGAPVLPLERNPGFPQAGTFATMAALAQEVPRTVASGAKAPARSSFDIGAGSPDPLKASAGASLPLDAKWLSRLLWHSMAISAWKQVPQTRIRYSLRVNPSSGNLHPTETHLAVRGFAGIPDGLYHYRADTHALEQRGRGDWVNELAWALENERAAEAPLIVALTSIFWREAWKYRDRAYRYCCHDLGHALMSLLLAARALGLTGSVFAQFNDPRVARILGLEHSDEAPMAFLAFDLARHAARREANRGEKAERIACTLNELSEEEVPYYLLLGMHRSTVLTQSGANHLPEAEEVKEVEEAEAAPAIKDLPLGETVRRRRSALDFDAHSAPMDRTELEQALDFATRDWLADWRNNLNDDDNVAPRRGCDFLELYVYAHRIRGLEPGVHRWRSRDRQLEPLHHGDVRHIAAYLSLEQPLAGHSCFTISMVADLAAATRDYGNRGYRYVHYEAGAIGQRLYLGAEALGWNATGIGAFYDDDVHRHLGFLEEGERISESAYAAEQALVQLDFKRAAPALSESREEQRAGATPATWHGPRSSGSDGRQLPRQVIYHFAVGKAVKDPRLEAPVE